MLENERFVVYGGTIYHGFDAEVIQCVNAVLPLDLRFSHCWHEVFTDGEPGFRMESPERIKGRHALIFSCPIDYKQEHELRDLVTGAKQQYGAKSVTVIMGFLRYRRQDRKDIHDEITRLRWFIRDLKHWGADRLVVCEPHSVAHTREYCREFGVDLHVADPTMIFVETLRPVVLTLGGPDNVRVYSPDFGSVGRAIAFAKALGTQVIAAPKIRLNLRVEPVDDKEFLEQVQETYGKDAPVSCNIDDLGGLHLLMREDEVDTGGTAIMTSRRLRKAGAGSIRLVATHPVCSAGWKRRFFPHGEENPFETVWLGDTRPRGSSGTEYEGSTGGRVKKVNLAPAVAKVLVEVLKKIKD